MKQQAHGGRDPAAIAQLSDFVHRNLLWFLLGSYGLAALAPSIGIWIKDVAFGTVPVVGTKVSLPMSLLCCY